MLEFLHLFHFIKSIWWIYELKHHIVVLFITHNAYSPFVFLYQISDEGSEMKYYMVPLRLSKIRSHCFLSWMWSSGWVDENNKRVSNLKQSVGTESVMMKKRGTAVMKEKVSTEQKLNIGLWRFHWYKNICMHKHIQRKTLFGFQKVTRTAFQDVISRSWTLWNDRLWLRSYVWSNWRKQEETD